MEQYHEQFSLSTRGAGLFEITDRFRACVSASGLATGLATVFCRHTSCSLIVQENADPDVQTDLMEFFRRLVPEDMDFIIHDAEGPDDMPAHIKAALTQTSIGIPFIDGAPVLGTWQGLYLFEHRTHPHRRDIFVHVLGER